MDHTSILLLLLPFLFVLYANDFLPPMYRIISSLLYYIFHLCEAILFHFFCRFFFPFFDWFQMIFANKMNKKEFFLSSIKQIITMEYYSFPLFAIWCFFTSYFTKQLHFRLDFKMIAKEIFFFSKLFWCALLWFVHFF